MENRKPSAPTRFVRAVQYVLAASGLAGAGFHSFPIHVGDPSQNWPVIDLVDLAWLALTAVSAVIPNIAEIDYGNFSLKIRNLEKSNARFDEVVIKMADLSQTWSSSATRYVNTMSDATTTPDGRRTAYKQFVLDRLGEACEIIATSLDGNIRLMLWVYERSSDVLIFATGYAENGVKPSRDEWSANDGLLGRSFREGRSYNVPDVTKMPTYVSTRPEPPPYKAVFCEPLRWGSQNIGVLTVDRSLAGRFTGPSEQAIIGVAALCALGVALFEKQVPSEPNALNA